MAFMKSNGVVTSFASYQDVVDKDQRLFEQNEGLDDTIIISFVKRATERLLTKIQATAWWVDQFSSPFPPMPDASKVIARSADFTEVCVCLALADYILPKVADFGNEESSERQKMMYYSQRAETMFNELMAHGDWYDFDGSGAMTASEKKTGYINLKRVR